MSEVLKSAYCEWIEKSFTPNKAVAFTLTFNQRCRDTLLSERIAKATLRRFTHDLCRKAFGSRKASNLTGDARLNWVAAFEGKAIRSPDAPQLHCHGVMQVPFGHSCDSWRNQCEESWGRLEWASKNSSEFVRYRSSGFITYMLKARTKDDWLEAIDFDTLQLRPSRAKAISKPLSFEFSAQ